jgi:hypothetical protein
VNDEVGGDGQMEQCVRGVYKRYCYDRVNTAENIFLHISRAPLGWEVRKKVSLRARMCA